MLLKVISQRYDWNCGDGCCSESQHSVSFLIRTEYDSWSKFWVEDFYGDAPETWQDLMAHYSDDEFIGSMLRQAAMCGHVEFEVTDDEFVGY